MDIGFHELPDNRRNVCIYGIGLLVALQTILMLACVIILGNVSPEVQTTLVDVNSMLPEMRRSLLDLGQMLPEIQTGMQILKQLCQTNEGCTIQV